MEFLDGIFENIGEIAMFIAAFFLAKNKDWKAKLKILRSLDKDLAKEEKKANKEVQKLKKINEKIETLKKEQENVGSQKA